ncbi:MAG: hypothetical protein ACSHX6_06235 [Akkermansiaceae bacterium]
MSPFSNPPCPQLPTITTPLPITHTREHRETCGPDYFTACLELAQSLWRTGSPAQAILQLDKSFMASTPENLPPENLPKAYIAILWIIQNTPADQFLGNPVRHFQHLATRMNMTQPNAKLRIWRAWACLHLTEKLYPNPAQIHPRDTHQIQKENLTIPTPDQTLDQITTLSTIQESVLLENLLLSHP